MNEMTTIRHLKDADLFREAALIGGAWLQAEGGATVDVTDPATGALLGRVPKAGWLLADRGHDADRFRNAWKDIGINPCIPGRKSRKKPVKYNKRRNRIGIVVGRPKNQQPAPSDTTAVQKLSSRQSCSPQPSCSGREPQ